MLSLGVLDERSRTCVFWVSYCDLVGSGCWSRLRPFTLPVLFHWCWDGSDATLCEMALGQKRVPLLIVVLRLAFVILGYTFSSPYDVTGTCFPRGLLLALLEVCNGHWSLWESRGYAPHGHMGLMEGYAACCTQYIRHSPLLPVQRWSIELPTTTAGEWWRRRSLRRHKGGLRTVPLTSCHHVLLQGGF